MKMTYFGEKVRRKRTKMFPGSRNMLFCYDKNDYRSIPIDFWNILIDSDN